jgi:hypothetical protein
MFPVLEPFEIERVRRFGKVRSYGDGSALAKVGEVGPGLDAEDGLAPRCVALRLSNNERVSARSLVIASGARYRRRRTRK